MTPLRWLEPALLALALTASDGPGPQSGPAAEREAYARHALSNRGDAARGRAVFEDEKGAGCVRCHRVRGRGGAIGPDLSSIGGKYAREHLIESVLEPSRQIVEGYRSTILELDDGRVLTGLIKAETADRLTLVDAEAREQAVAKKAISGRKFADVSIMPEGLASGLTRTQFADLIAYLQGLRDADQPTPGSGIVGPVKLPPGFAMNKVAGGLTAATAMAVAPDGRVFVCEQTGTLRVIKDGQLRPEPFLTVPVDSHWERGLIGVALDPGFDSNGFVYVTYVAADPYPHHRVSRFTARGDVAVPGSEVVLLRGDDQRKLGGPEPSGPSGRGAALRPGRQAVHRHRRADRPRARAAARHVPGQAAADQPRRHDPRGQSVLPEGEREVPRHLGDRPAESVHLRRAAGHRADLHQRRGGQRLGGGRRGLRRRELRLARVRGRDQRPAVPRPDPHLPGRVGRRRGVLPEGCGRRLPRRVPGEILLHGLRPGLDQGPRPRPAGPGWRRSPRG